MKDELAELRDWIKEALSASLGVRIELEHKGLQELKLARHNEEFGMRKVLQEIDRMIEERDT